MRSRLHEGPPSGRGKGAAPSLRQTLLGPDDVHHRVDECQVGERLDCARDGRGSGPAPGSAASGGLSTPAGAAPPRRCREAPGRSRTGRRSGSRPPSAASGQMARPPSKPMRMSQDQAQVQVRALGRGPPLVVAVAGVRPTHRAAAPSRTAARSRAPLGPPRSHSKRFGNNTWSASSLVGGRL